MYIDDYNGSSKNTSALSPKIRPAFPPEIARRSRALFGSREKPASRGRSPISIYSSKRATRWALHAISKAIAPSVCVDTTV